MQNLVICYCAYAWQLDVFVKRNLRNSISTVKSVNHLKILFSQREVYGLKERLMKVIQK